jgi:hypothetical protein
MYIPIEGASAQAKAKLSGAAVATKFSIRC